MKNNFLYKILLYILTIISIISLGLFNFYMSSYYHSPIGIINKIDPLPLFFVILLIVLLQLIIAFKLLRNK